MWVAVEFFVVSEFSFQGWDGTTINVHPRALRSCTVAGHLKQQDRCIPARYGQNPMFWSVQNPDRPAFLVGNLDRETNKQRVTGRPLKLDK